MEATVSFTSIRIIDLLTKCSDEEDPEEYHFPLTLKLKKGASSGPNSPGLNGPINGTG